jgi:hypothetical protein
LLFSLLTLSSLLLSSLLLLLLAVGGWRLAVVVVVVVQRVCFTHRNTVSGPRPFFEKFAFSKRGMPS